MNTLPGLAFSYGYTQLAKPRAMNQLTKEEQDRIRQEEQLRAQARYEAEKKQKPKVTNAAGCLILIIVLPILFFLALYLIQSS
jgi:hypothetical protein